MGSSPKEREKEANLRAKTADWLDCSWLGVLQMEEIYVLRIMVANVTGSAIGCINAE